jgi:hypothetical protein
MWDNQHISTQLREASETGCASIQQIADDVRLWALAAVHALNTWPDGCLLMLLQLRPVEKVGSATCCSLAEP